MTAAELFSWITAGGGMSSSQGLRRRTGTPTPAWAMARTPRSHVRSGWLDARAGADGAEGNTSKRPAAVGLGNAERAELQPDEGDTAGEAADEAELACEAADEDGLDCETMDEDGAEEVPASQPRAPAPSPPPAKKARLSWDEKQEKHNSLMEKISKFQKMVKKMPKSQGNKPQLALLRSFWECGNEIVVADAQQGPKGSRHERAVGLEQDLRAQDWAAGRQAGLPPRHDDPGEG